MFLTASSDAHLSAGTLALLTCFSLCCLLNGVRHYRGRGTWMLSWLPSRASFFTTAWCGAFGLMVVLSDLAGRVSAILEAVLGIPTFVLLAIMLMSLVWLPGRLLPTWYRDQQSRAAAFRHPPPWRRRATRGETQGRTARR